jgi:hypothetical protein|tara:strand:+ start:1102 stop:1371 length:270 start_codon:yes stop_codon:yes gene_type:complete
MIPYTETEIGQNQYIREFSSDVDTHELEWHLDRENRLIEVVENNGGWEVQIDNNLPCLMEDSIFIPKETYHRVIKGSGKLVVKITKMYE